MADIQYNPEKIIARLHKDHRWKSGNMLQLLAERLSLYAIPTEQLLSQDVTKLFLAELRREVRLKEIIKIVINGKMRLGKSTVGILLGQYVHQELKKNYKSNMGHKEFGIWNIARDEQEYLGKMRNPDLMYDVIVVDERNAMDETGENATVEIKQKEMFSDIQAARYVHTIMITPEKDVDDNNDIKLVVRSREGGFSHCRLFYRLNKGSYSQWMLLGYVNLDVKSLVKSWLKVEKRFMKYIQNKFSDDKEKEADKKFVEYWRNKDFYIDYMFRKYEKMELMNREGILRERELDYAELMLNVIQEVKDYVGIMNLMSLKRYTTNLVEMEFRKMKIPFSMLGIEKTSERVMAVVSLYRTLEEINQKIIKLKARKKTKKIDLDDYDLQMDKLSNMKKKLIESIKFQLKEWGRYSELAKKYNVLGK